MMTQQLHHPRCSNSKAPFAQDHMAALDEGLALRAFAGSIGSATAASASIGALDPVFGAYLARARLEPLAVGSYGPPPLMVEAEDEAEDVEVVELREAQVAFTKAYSDWTNGGDGGLGNLLTGDGEADEPHEAALGGSDDGTTASQRSARAAGTAAASCGGAVKRRADVGSQSLGDDGCMLPAKRARFDDRVDAGATPSECGVGVVADFEREDIGVAVTCDAEGSHNPRAHREGRRNQQRQKGQHAGTSGCGTGDSAAGAAAAPGDGGWGADRGSSSGRAYRCATSPERSDGLGSSARGAPLTQPTGAIATGETTAAPHRLTEAAVPDERAGTTDRVGSKASDGAAGPCTHNESTHAFIAGVARAAAEAAYASALAAVYRSFGCTCTSGCPTPTPGPPAAHRRGRG